MICLTTLGMKCLYAPAPKNELYSPGIEFLFAILDNSFFRSNSEVGEGKFKSGNLYFSGMSEKRSLYESTPISDNISFFIFGVFGV